MSAPPVEMLLFLLRKAVFSEAAPDYAALLPLLRQTVAFLEREEPDNPATDGYTSDLAHLTAVMIEESHSPGVLKAGLEILLRLGRVGESLAVSFAGKEILPPEHLVAVFGALPAGEKLLLANALLRFPRKIHPEVSRFAAGVLETAIDQEPDDILVLCDTLFLRDEPPSPAVRNECLHGRLGIWLSQLVKMDLYPEQTGFMARMAAVLRSAALAEPLLHKEGGLSSQAVGDVCRAVAEYPCPASGPCIAALTDLLAAREPGVLLAVMETLCQVAPEHAVMQASGLLASRPDARFVLFALPFFLPHALLPAFLRAVPADVRPRFLISFLWVLARCTDAGLAPLLKHLRQSSASPAATAMSGALTEILRQASVPVPPRLRRITATPPSESETEGLLGRLKSLVGMRPEGAGRAGASPLDDLAPGAGLSESSIIGETHQGRELRDVVFTRVHLESLDLSRCVMARAVFRDCRIRKVDFTLARLAGVRFEACRLEHCRFSGMAASGLVFSGCDMAGVCLGDCEAREVRLSGCALRDCDFFGARLADFQAVESRFECVNFSRAAFSRARFQGLDLRDCTIENVLFQGLEAVCCHGSGTHLSRCVFQDLKSDDPLFLAAELRSGRDLFLDRIQNDNPDPDPAFLQKESLSLAMRLIENWSFDMETRRRRVTVLAHNCRRLDWTMEKLGEEDTQFLRCLPGLLEAPKAWTPDGWIAAVPATIPGHRSTFEAERALRQIMGEACPPHAPSTKGVTISGVFSMGSLGTVAQTPSSDLDIWVCLADDDMTRRLMDRFRKKLDGLRFLAASRGMETHFFVMTEADVRENRLGLGDEEECGLARAMLLKEEFLRTALFLAGRKPAWWYVAPGMDPASYRRAVSRLVRPDAPAAFEAMDMGPVDRMAGGGFFGASLWTIVKSLENPFKAVMKFALLEKYLSSGAASTLLCDRIKKHLFAGRTGLLDTDPYILLLDEVRGFHENQGNSEALALIRLAFTQKTGIDPGDLDASRSDGEGRACGEGLFRAHFFFDLDECRAVRAAGTTDRQPASPDGSIAELTVAGKKIADFLFGTYERLRARLSVDETMIGSEADQRDLAILGRRILSRFGVRKNKIARIPFVRPPHGLLHSLEIIFDGPDQGFTARGECRRRDGRKVPEHIRSEPSLERLAGWLAANDFHRPGVYLKAGAIKAPLSFPDVQALLAALADTFPLGETFNPPLAEGLVPERLVKALILINFHVPREEKDIVEAGFYYSNNWGELFYVDKAQALDLLVTAPHDFLRYNTGLDVDALARIETLSPVKASCPRLKLSFYA